jgi:putative SOS response-associated peptidase YedK
MCGRFALKAPAAELVKYFGLDECVDLMQRYNIPPGTEIAAIRQSPAGQRVLHRLKWGLVPNWTKDPNIGNRLNNARGETVADKPSFREAFKRRRCLIPADGFYEWSARGKLKQPWYISLKSGQPMAMAGLWEAWTSLTGDILRTCCVITTGPNDVMQAIHDRMPVLISPQDWGRWLSGPADAVAKLVRPYVLSPDGDAMQAWPVDRRVSKTSEDVAELIRSIRGE